MMDFHKGSIALGVIALLVVLVIAPLVWAHITRIPVTPVTVRNVNGGPLYNALMVGDANDVISCLDTDGGFNPTTSGDLNARFPNHPLPIQYVDGCVNTQTLLEYACGKDVNVNNDGARVNHAYAFKYDCGDLNKTCSAGRCI
ncbi:MAG: hypothetical protein Q8P05_04355 [Candidatus Diapherotrites archaeon]|nr:hypothetical protein [Candidatus Diapherotrites archaeon]MDZ4256908.1 hypothetical protein [archaeon]